MLTDDVKRELQEALTKERQMLEANLEDLGAQDPEDRTNWDAKFPNMEEEKSGSSSILEEGADEVEEFDRRIETESVQRDRYRDVLRALKKLDTEGYGLCESCGNEIPLERLRANPAARTDIEHAE
jgi:RNA polymerase-binding transcription factor DksA